MDNFSTKVPTPCGESALPKAKLESASSVLSMIRKTSRKKVNCFSALISSFKDLKFHRNDIDTVTLNLSSLAAHSRNHKLWGSVEVVEASLSTTSTLPLQWTFFDDIRCKGALVGTETTFLGHYNRQRDRFKSSRMSVLRIGVAMRSNITQFFSINNDDVKQKNTSGGFP